MKFILVYGDKTKETGERFSGLIDTYHVKELKKNSENILDGKTVLIKYGVGDEIPREYKSLIVYNSDIKKSSNKVKMVSAFKANGVPSPDVVTLAGTLIAPFDGFIRSKSHTRGNNMNFVERGREITLSDDQYFIKKENIAEEYRAFVIRNKVWEIDKKIKIDPNLEITEDEEIFGGEETPEVSATDNNEARTFNNGWILKPVNLPPEEAGVISEISIKAIHAVGLDFGAVDIIKSQEGKFMALETNAGASLKVPRKIHLFIINILKDVIETVTSREWRELEEIVL